MTKVLVFPLKYKDQVLDVLKEIYTKLKMKWKTTKVTRSDNDDEYRVLFESYYKDHLIKLKRTPSKAPQHNGVVEVMNKTTEVMIRCILSHAKLPKPFWEEAMRYVVDLINLSPSATLDGDIPNKVWTGK